MRQNPKHKLELRKDGLKPISVLTASDLDGVCVLKKVTGTLQQKDKTHTHLAQKMDKLWKELEEAGLVVNPTIASCWQSELADKGHPV